MRSPHRAVIGDKSPPLDAKMDILIKTLDVVVGGEIFLLCKAGGEGEIKWKKDGEEIDDEDKVSKVDESSSKLIIKNASMQDAGRYTCLCEFENGHNDDVTKQIYVYEGPSFGSTVTYHEFLEGTDGVVPYLVTGQPAVDVHWLRNKEQISSNAGQHVHQRPDNTVLIEKVRRDDAGTYLCEAIIRGRPIHKELPITVVVNAPPTAHLRAEVKKVMAGPETNVSLLCLVSGHPKPNITWITPVTADPSRHHFNSDRSQLTIRSVARADYGEYICTAANKIAENNDTYMLHVNAKASSMTTGRVVGIVMVILLMVFLVVVIITFQTFLCVAAEK
ncbi:neural cell adhesion molecule 1-like [Sebastes fasciatus]|uniref:neural cell adhesion molecule 1-like n=1 Tax=Sebastes fasciatus TaxID=394691 RepID=UPI003D9E16F4